MSGGGTEFNVTKNRLKYGNTISGIFCLTSVFRQLFENFKFGGIRLNVLQLCKSQTYFSQLIDFRYVTTTNRSINDAILILDLCVLFHRAALEENAYNRMKKVVKWYLSGFYKKPKVYFHMLFCL